jgi:hypothetical protein
VNQKFWISGLGFGIGPAFGKIVAQMVNKESSQHHLKRFRFSRFTDGSPLDIEPNNLAQPSSPCELGKEQVVAIC